MANTDRQQSPQPSPSSSPPLSPHVALTPDTELPSPGTDSLSQPRLSPRSNSDYTSAATVSATTSSWTPLGSLNVARGRPSAPASTTSSRGSTPMPPDIMAKMKAFSVSRQGPAAPIPNRGPANAMPANSAPGGFPAGFKVPPQFQRPPPHVSSSLPAVPGAHAPAPTMSFAEKRGLKLGGLPGQSAPSSPPPAAGGKQKPKMSLSQMGGPMASGSTGTGGESAPPQKKEQTQMDKYAEFIDTKTGALNFKGKATLHGQGIDFKDGRSFNISLDEVDTMDELGKGNYGTVYKVRHARPRFRKQGQGLAGNKSRDPHDASLEQLSSAGNTPATPTRGGGTGVVMAMKEIRLELDDAKFAAIIMELDILHRCASPHIVDFYGAFFQEGAVYICLEFMDGGSIDRLYGDGVPEHVLRKITLSTVLGLKFLKEDHNIIHRDVKPTNILANRRGQIKICDFGVSGNLVASIAKTNIGCQSYMAPERISSGGVAAAGAVGGSYNVQSDIWSLGLTIIECAMGRYPYPPDTYDNIFSQLSAIVDGDPPDLPADTFSVVSRDFVAGCLNKIPRLRPSYPLLLQHAWLAPLVKPQTIVEEDEDEDASAAPPSASAGDRGGEEKVFDADVAAWVVDALGRRRRGELGTAAQPALHAAPLDVGTPQVEQSEATA